MAVELPVPAQVLQHGRGDGHHAVAPAFAAPYQELALVPEDVMDGQVQALGQPQPAAIDQFGRGAVPPQPDGAEQVDNLLARQHFRQPVVVLGADLVEHLPALPLQLAFVEQPRTSRRLSHGLGRPALDGLEVQEVVPHLRLGQPGRIRASMFGQEPQLAVVGMPRADMVVAQRQETGVPLHRGIQVLVIQRVGFAAESVDGTDTRGLTGCFGLGFIFHNPTQ